MIATIARWVLAHKRLVVVFWIVLTVVGGAASGAATVEDLRLEARRSGEAFFGRLSAEERATLHRLLRKLAALD